MNQFEDASQPDSEPEAILPARQLADGGVRAYVRVASLGDSATFGIGDRVGSAWRGWAVLLAEAIAVSHDVSFANLARSGATIADVERDQISDALDHRPHLATLVVGINDTLRSWWDADQARRQLLSCAARMDGQRALLLTVRFHDHAELLPLPRQLRVRLGRRIDALNEMYEEVHDRFGGIQIDLRDHAEPLERDFWSIDRMHPSERGHRWLAHTFSTALNGAGLVFEPPALSCTSNAPSRAENVRWLVREGGPWLGRRAKDFAPWAARETLVRAHLHAA